MTTEIKCKRCGLLKSDYDKKRVSCLRIGDYRASHNFGEPSDLKPFVHGEEGTHSVCNKHNIGGKSVCCECSGKTDCKEYNPHTWLDGTPVFLSLPREHSAYVNDPTTERWREDIIKEWEKSPASLRVVALEIFAQNHGFGPYQDQTIPEFWLAKLARQKEEVLAEERQFILNVLDGVDVADKEMGNTGGGTKAIRFALKNRV